MLNLIDNRFVELGSILEPGRPPKTDKAAILIDAVRMVNQLRGEVLKLKDSNSSLQEKIKELKARVYEFLYLKTNLYFMLFLLPCSSLAKTKKKRKTMNC